MSELSSQLESLLFVSSKPLHTRQLAKLTNSSEDSVTTSLLALQEQRKDSGVIVLEANGFWQMATNAENAELVKKFLNADLREKLTDATVEVLSIIAYRQPIAKAEIEAIRGVNSQYSIRHLLMRGLIEKIPNPNDARGSLYQVTTEFLQHLGIQSVRDLPEFESLVAHIKLPETPSATSVENPEDPTEEKIEEVEETEELVVTNEQNEVPQENTDEDDIEEEEFDDDEDDEDEED